jgi:hypothetical protein
LNGDQNASLSLKDGNQGIIYKCFAGCAPDAIRNALKEKFGWVEPALESRSCRNSNFCLPYAYRDSLRSLHFEKKDKRRLGSAIAGSGATLTVGSDSEFTADKHAVEGYLPRWVGIPN